MNVIDTAIETIRERKLAGSETPVMLMVSGGSDSTALAYIARELKDQNKIGPLGMVHVNHELRGEDSDTDAGFVEGLAAALDIPLATVRVNVKALVESEHGNLEAIARRERYAAAQDALAQLCLEHGLPTSQGRLFVAHTADDRVENFYMRSIVGTGPGGFRSMLYLNGEVARPLLDCGREDLRDYIRQRAEDGLLCVRDAGGALWREDATNEHTDRFRTFVRHEIVPIAKEKNPQLNTTLTRAMNLIGDEDDMLDAMAENLVERHVVWLEPVDDGCVLSPWLAAEPVPLQRRVAVKVLETMLGCDARIETATVSAVLGAFSNGKPIGGYVANVQGNLAVSANRNGVRIEPMAAFRMRRNRM